MDIRTLPIDQLNPAPYNPRVDLQPGDKQYDLIKKGIEEFGLVDPLVWNEKTGNLVGGHQRLKVLVDLGYTEVEVSVVSLSLTKEKALNVALNKLSGDWDMPKLKDLLQEIDTGELDLSLTGFDETEIGNLMMQFHIPDSEPEYDESVAKDVKTAICPNCQHEFPV
jgi:ParB-like chromosome segregation protein Spo0J